MVGGRVIEIAPRREAFGYPATMHDCVRLWCVDGADECAVYAAMPNDGVLPKIGQEIWWQSGKIYFDGDQRSLMKLGNSHDPRNV